jgi:hypothetical protein
MLSFAASILLNLIVCAESGPLDWARVEIPWARADRSECYFILFFFLKEIVTLNLSFLISHFHLKQQFRSMLIYRGYRVSHA